jgi:pimeloyl-ACP methyl ester carboxylesterase
MLSRLKRVPLAVLCDFYKITDPAKRFRFSALEFSTERLAADLHLLDQIDISEDSQLSKLKSKAIVVHGLEDTLISEQQSLSLARLLNAETLICRAGHDLPLSHTNACIDLITKIILTLNETRSECCA